jgi:hypothetical protein
LFFVAGMSCFAFILLNFLFGSGTRRFRFTYLDSKVFCLLVVLIQVLLSLTSTQNKGSAFVLPSIPLLAILSVYSINRLLDTGLLKLFAALIGGSLASCSFILFLNIVRFPHIEIFLPIINWKLSVLDDRSVYEIYAGYYDPSPSDKRFRPVQSFDNHSQEIGLDRSRYWSESLSSISNYLRTCAHSNIESAISISFGVRHFLLNPNSLRAYHLLSHKTPIFSKLTMIEPFLFKDTEYQNWFNSDKGSQDFLLTLSSSDGSFSPAVNQKIINSYAHRYGYSIVKSFVLPSEQVAYIWSRQPLRKGHLASEECLRKG